jgi:hypothetical protein
MEQSFARAFDSVSIAVLFVGIRGATLKGYSAIDK